MFFKKCNSKTKLSFNTLEKKDMFNITGGMELDGCTCGTYSECNADGTIDCDC